MPIETCSHCNALYPARRGLWLNGRRVCCAACTHHPRGCRCHLGEWGQPQTEYQAVPEVMEGDAD